jgi:hypothetical protein
MKISRISRRTLTPGTANDGTRRPRRIEVVRTIVAVTLAVGLVGTGAIALPSLVPVVLAGVEIPPTKGPQLEPEDLGDVATITEATRTLGGPLTETVSDIASALPSAAARVAKATTAVTKPIADGVDVLPLAARISRATAHEAIKMRKGIIPLIPSKFAQAENGISMPVSLTQYCVQGETRRGRQLGMESLRSTSIFCSPVIEVFLARNISGRYLVDDTGGNAWCDTRHPGTDCKEAAPDATGGAVLVAREVGRFLEDSPMPTVGRTRENDAAFLLPQLALHCSFTRENLTEALNVLVQHLPDRIHHPHTSGWRRRHSLGVSSTWSPWRHHRHRNRYCNRHNPNEAQRSAS